MAGITPVPESPAAALCGLAALIASVLAPGVLHSRHQAPAARDAAFRGDLAIYECLRDGGGPDALRRTTAALRAAGFDATTTDTLARLHFAGCG